jgi:hypothetical protein
MLGYKDEVNGGGVAIVTKQELNNRLNYVVLRTERGNAVVRRNPRELPRRLRVLLLAIDGTHTVQLYVQTLRGFGDIAELLIELITLGLAFIQSPGEAETSPQKSTQYSAIGELLDDSRFDSQSAADMLYGSTEKGSFDDMLRVARIEVPDIDLRMPAAPAPAPISPAAQKIQIQSLFDLLDAVRGERKNLRQRVAKMDRLRAAAIKLDKENQRLFNYLFALSTVCCALLVTVALFVVRR